jgi:tetratricopeptide (TPR) repeat protein
VKTVRIFKKKTKTADAEMVEKTYMTKPTSWEDYLKRGWAFYGKKDYKQAENDFRKTLSMQSDSVDAHFALGLVCKVQSRYDDAVKSFAEALKLLESKAEEDPGRRQMLRRLIKGHINELTKGDWDLEKEMWQSR